MKTWKTRWEYLEPHVREKTVLEVGPAELVGTVNSNKMERWLHGRIAKTARRLVGVELSDEQVRALVAKGYDIRVGDAQTFQLNERFEVVFAGEVLEHLSNPGEFLERAKEHLVPGGQLILTTPNRFNILTVTRVVRTGKVPEYTKPIAKHVAYYDSDSLKSLLERHGFTNVEVGYCMWVGAPGRTLSTRSLMGSVRRLRPTMLPVLLARATVR